MNIMRYRVFDSAIILLTSIILLLCAAGSAGAIHDNKISDSIGRITEHSSILSEVSVAHESYPQTGEGDITVIRTLPSEVQPGEKFTIRFTTNLVNGGIEEQLPNGFLMGGTSTLKAPCTMIARHYSATNRITFLYIGVLDGQCTPGTFSYEAIAPSSIGNYVFSGTMSALIANEDRIVRPIGGDAEIKVSTSSQPPSNIKIQRTLPAAIVAPGEQFQVSIEFEGIAPGDLTETLPDGFTYVDGSENSSIDKVEKQGNEIIFGFMSEPHTITYQVRASDIPGTYDFSGTVKGFQIGTSSEVERNVTGDTRITVQTTDQQQPLAITTGTAEPQTCENTALLSGTVLSMGDVESISVSFEWGQTDSYGNTANVGNMTTAGGFSTTIEDLVEGIMYHYRAKAITNGETAYGNDRTFSAGKCPDETTSPVPGPTMYQMVTNVSPAQSGLVQVTPAGPEYESGTQVTLTAVAADDYVFDKWMGDTSGTGNPKTVTVDSNLNIIASFAKTTTITTTEPMPQETPKTSVTPTPPKTTKTTTPTPAKTTSVTGTSDNGKPSKTYNITDIGSGNGNDSNNGDGDDNGGGTNLWVIIGPLIGVVVIGCILAYYLVGRKPESGL